MTTKVVTWHSGPPPHTGWWLANTGRRPNMWSWYDAHSGKWSVGAFDDDLPEQAAFTATQTRYSQRDMMWSDYYPKNARVPRVDPRSHYENLKIFSDFVYYITESLPQDAYGEALGGFVEKARDALIALGLAR